MLKVTITNQLEKSRQCRLKCAKLVKAITANLIEAFAMEKCEFVKLFYCCSIRPTWPFL